MLEPFQAGRRTKDHAFGGDTYAKSDLLIVREKDGDFKLTPTTGAWPHIPCVLGLEKKLKAKDTESSISVDTKRPRDDHAEHSPEIYGLAVLSKDSHSEGFKAACKNVLSIPPDERELLIHKYANAGNLKDEDLYENIPQVIICASSYLSLLHLNPFNKH